MIAIGILAACLRPFGYRPLNQVSWNSDTTAVIVREPGMAYTDPFLLQPDVDTFSLTLSVIPGNNKKGSIHSIVTFCDSAWNERFLVAQWRDQLLLLKMSGHRRVAVHELDVKQVLHAGRKSRICITQKGREVTVLVDSAAKKHTTAFLLFDRGSVNTYRMCIGNSPLRNRNWEGEISGFSFTAGNVGVRFPRYEQDPANTLRFHVPERIPRIRTSFLTRSAEYWKTPGYIADLFFNLIGFIPLGFFLALSVRSRFAVSKCAICLAVTAAGFLLSLVVETSQMYIYHRYSQLTDLCLNTLGSGLGAIIALWNRWVRDRFIEVPYDRGKKPDTA